MKHFKTEEWIDYVNQVTSPKQQEAMRKHLGTSCKQCKETVALWQRLQKTATREAGYQPSAADVRIAKAAFVAAGRAVQPRTKSGFIKVLFDSFSQPLLAGGRFRTVGARQMLYPVDPFPHDIHIEGKSGGERRIVTVDLLGCSEPRISD